MTINVLRVVIPSLAACTVAAWIPSGLAETLDQYYAHRRTEDALGVIAPWHAGQNGPCDLRIRIAAECMKRYPWVTKEKAVLAAPHFIYNTHWKIDSSGTISIPPTDPWMCGDLSQRVLSIIRGMAHYYRYSGDPVAFAWVSLAADYVLDYCLTDSNHPWPRFPVSTPTRGIGYGRAEAEVPNQLDLCAALGTEMVRAYKLIGNPRYLEAAKHWGDVIAEHCNLQPELPPWSRYVNPQHAPWSDELTSGVTLILEFLDELLALGHRGTGDALVKARDAGRAYLRDDLLPRWTDNEVWGRHYWDWENPVMCGIVPWCCEYFMSHPDAFPNWRTDVRNILSLIFNRNCVNPDSRGDVYSGAWAFPETSSCCGTSLSYNQYTYATAFAQYGVLAGDEWALEISRRMAILATYDSDENGVVLDGIDGKVVAAGEWLNLAHPWPLCQGLIIISWLPEIFGPQRENHIVRSASVITSVVYDKGRVSYSAFDAPAGSLDVLRLAFRPRSIKAEGQALAVRERLDENGYAVKPIDGGDFLVTVRRDGAKSVVVEGDDPQEMVDDEALSYSGSWAKEARAASLGGTVRSSSAAGASATLSFKGNQVRILGPVGPEGGLADVWLDGKKELTVLDFWSPSPRESQVVYYKSGIPNENHEIRLVARGARNPVSKGDAIFVEAIQHSAQAGAGDWGAGGGPRGPQRFIMGYAGRKDYIDSGGNPWRPGTEFVVRSGNGSDSVATSWWKDRRSIYIGNTPDPELYRYGVHGREFWVHVTAGPGRYRLRLLFADTWTQSVVTVKVNGKEAIRELDVAKAAGGRFKALDRIVDDVTPRGGTIEIRFLGAGDKEASVQAIEVLPCDPAAPGKS